VTRPEGTDTAGLAYEMMVEARAYARSLVGLKP